MDSLEGITRKDLHGGSLGINWTGVMDLILAVSDPNAGNLHGDILRHKNHRKEHED